MHAFGNAEIVSKDIIDFSAIRSLVQCPAYYISCDGPVSVNGHVP